MRRRVSGTSGEDIVCFDPEDALRCVGQPDQSDATSSYAASCRKVLHFALLGLVRPLTECPIYLEIQSLLASAQVLASMAETSPNSAARELC